MLYDGGTIEVDGHKFRVEFPYDDSGDAPWEREDGHGPVSEWTTRAKRPGEMVLDRDRGSYRYYDFQEAVRIAKRDGWDAEPYGQGTNGERAHRAAMADFDRLHRWCNDQWSYVGAVVELLDDDGEPTGDKDSLWGIESDCPDYLEEVARECAGEVLAQLERNISRALPV